MGAPENLHAFRQTFLCSLDPKPRRALELFAEAMYEVDALDGEGGFRALVDAGMRDLAALAEWFERLHREPASTELAPEDLERAERAGEIARTLRSLL